MEEHTGQEIVLWASLEKTFCPGVPSGHSDSQFSPVQSVLLCFQDSPEVAFRYGFRLRVRELPSKSGLGANEAPENQFFGYSSLSALLSYLLDSQPKHDGRAGTLKACPSVGKWGAHGSWQLWIPARPSLSVPVLLFSVALTSTFWARGSAL